MTLAAHFASISRKNQLENTTTLIEDIKGKIAEAAALGYFEVEIPEPAFNIDTNILVKYFTGETFQLQAYVRDSKRFISLSW